VKLQKAIATEPLEEKQKNKKQLGENSQSPAKRPKISISGDRNVLLLFPLNFPTSVVQAQTEGKIHTSIDIIINTVSTSIFSQYNQLTRQELELLSKEIIKRFPGLADYYEQESYVSSPSFFILLIISF